MNKIIKLKYKMVSDSENLKKVASQVRRDILRMVHGASSGHPGGSLGCVEFLVALFFNELKMDPTVSSKNVREQDCFILSNGHISPVYYSVMARKGFFDIRELAEFRKYGSRLQGHPTPAKGLPGVCVATGSLGQGLSVALGVAQGKKLNENKSNIVYSLHGDGELQEGQCWEAIMYAGAKKVDNIIMTIDWNNAQIDGSCDKVCNLGDLEMKFNAFGWEVLVSNGNDLDGIAYTLKLARSKAGCRKPIVILMKTQMGFGVDFMMGTNAWHGKAPSDRELQDALSQLKETLGDY